MSVSRPIIEYVAPSPRFSLQAFCETAETAAAIQEAAEDRRMVKAHVRVQMGGIAAAIEAYRGSPTPNLVLIESKKGGETILQELDALAEVCDVGTQAIVIGHLNDVRLCRDVVRRGAHDYLLAPLAPVDIVRAVSELFEAPNAPSLGRIVAIVGAKGGVGASTMAHNIAWTVARDLAMETVITDLDLPFGTASLDYDQDPSRDIAAAVCAPDRVDAPFIDGLLSRCAERLSLLAAPETIDRPYDFAAETFDPVIEALRARAPCVVLDVPHIWTGWSKRILLGADEILLVATPELASLRNARLLLEMLRAARPDNRPVSYCLNQVGVPNRPEIRAVDFARAVDCDPLAVIPFEPQLFGVAAHEGRMIAEIAAGHPVAATLRDIARTLTGSREPKQGRAGGHA